MYSDMSKRISSTPSDDGKLLCDFRLADAGRTGEQIAADRLFRLAQARARELDRCRQRLDRLVLAIDDRLQRLLEMPQHLGIVLRDRLRRYPRHRRDRRLDFLDADRLLAPALGQQHLRRAGLIDHVDRLVRQLAVMDIARRQLDRRLDGLVGVFEFVILLEVRLQPLQDLDRIRHRRLVDVDLLEAAHQCTILLEILPVFLVGGRADAADRARREGRLEQIGSIHRAAGGGAGADHGVNFVDEHDRAGIRLDFLDDLLETFLEIAAISGAGEQRAHVERKHRRALEHVRNLAVHDPACKTFGDRGFADAGIADEQRIVLLPAAQNLNGAIDLGIAADQRIDFAVLGLLVEIDAIGLERIALFLRLVTAFGVGFLFDATHGPRFRQARPLGDAMADVIDRVVARHVLLLQEIGGMALALGENRHQHIGAGYFLAPGGLHVNDRALDHALKACGRLGILSAIGDQIFEFGFEIRRQAAPQLVEIDIAGAHHRGSVLIVDQRQQQMLKRCVLVMPLVGDCKRAVKRLFETSGESWHSNLPVHRRLLPRLTFFPSRIAKDADVCAQSPSPV